MNRRMKIARASRRPRIRRQFIALPYVDRLGRRHPGGAESPGLGDAGKPAGVAQGTAVPVVVEERVDVRLLPPESHRQGGPAVERLLVIAARRGGGAAVETEIAPIGRSPLRGDR